MGAETQVKQKPGKTQSKEQSEPAKKPDTEPDAATQSTVLAAAVEPQTAVAEETQPTTQEGETVTEAASAQVAAPVILGSQADQLPVISQLPAELQAPLRVEQLPQTDAAALATAEADPQIPTGDIVATQTTVVIPDNAPAADTRTPTQITPPGQSAVSQERFDSMVNQAQQELAGMNQTEQQPEAPTVELQQQAPQATLPQESEFSGERTETPQQDQPATALTSEPTLLNTELPPAEEQREQTPLTAANTTAALPQPQPQRQTSNQQTATGGQRQSFQETPQRDAQAVSAQRNQQAAGRDSETIRLEQASSQVQQATPQPQMQGTEQVAQTDQTGQRLENTDQVRQIQDQIEQNLQQSRTEFTMQLKPEELGKIDIKMVLEGGRLAVEIMAHSTRTAELLTRNTEGLISSLRMNHLNLESVQVVSSPQAAGSQMESAFNMYSGQNGGWSDQSQPGQTSGQLGRAAGSGGGAAMDRGEEFAEADTRPGRAPESLLDYAI